MQVETRILRRPRHGEPMIIAVFSYRYEAHLVAGLIANLSPVIHGYVALDDSNAKSAFSSEPERRRVLLAAAKAAGAVWILAIDPDERLEQAAARRIRELTKGAQNILWSFVLREMFGPDHYRVDGLWGRKWKTCLFPAAAVSDAEMADLHGPWIAPGRGFDQQHSGLNLYHLRMATPARRTHRRVTYAALDPERHMQPLGYDYLDDERGMVLETVPPGRGFVPAFVEDGGLWAAQPEKLGRVQPDHDRARLIYVERMRATRGAASALPVMQDMVRARDGDTDLSELCARLALEAGKPGLAVAISDSILARQPDQAHALVTQAQARMMQGDVAAARAALQRARALVPDSAWLRHLATALQRDAGWAVAPDAAWRYWARGEALLHEGAAVGRGDLAVVVIGYRAPPELVNAVASVLSQGDETEVVVVNSGGGPVRQLLAAHLDRIRLIEVAGRLRVGAARNLGIDASAARFVAFLAGDCQALPGWVAGRLALHRGGDLAVASAVVPEDPRNPSSAASAFIYHHRRRPQTPAAEAKRYGLSCARVLMSMFGYFQPDTVLGEDTAFNTLVARSFQPVWAPQVVMTHRYPTTPYALLHDHMRRGYRRLAHLPALLGALGPAFSQTVRQQLDKSLVGAQQALRDWGGFDPFRRRQIVRLQRRAIEADHRGLMRAARAVERARADMDRARADVGRDPQAAIALAQAALAQAPQLWSLHLACAEVLLAADAETHLEPALAALRAAQGLAPAEAAPAQRLHALLTERGRHACALAEAERAVILAPTLRLHHEHAARAALALNLLPLARLHAHANLVAAAYHLQPHIFLADLNTRLGLAALAASRRAMCRDFTARHNRLVASRKKP